jgi:hypothetical protein
MQEKSWSTDPDGFRTLVNIQKSEYPLNHRDGIMLTGSCFTEHIGKRLADSKFTISLNPFGIVYHPAAIGYQLQRLLSGVEYTPGELVFRDGLWHSFDHHGSFSNADQQICLNTLNSHLLEASAFIRKAGQLILTFGSARAYHLKSSGKLVSNCHKFPDSDFTSRFYEPDEILDSLLPALSELRSINPGIRFIWSVSPVRYLKEGTPGNQLSKASLIQAVAGLMKRFPDSCYFPSYEIFMDDLRDYRFYDTDLVHPGPAGIAYVWKRFCEAFIEQESLDLMKRIDPIVKAAAHRPMGGTEESLRNFRAAQLDKIYTLKKEFPWLDMTSESELFSKE